MNKRELLKSGDVLPLGGSEYVIEEVIGKGSCAVTYRARYLDSAVSGAVHHVLVKELFPFDPADGIYRADGRICVDESSREKYELYKESFERGNRVHLSITEKFPDKNGVNINTFAQNGTLYTVIGFSGGRDMETELLTEGSAELSKTADRIIGILSALDEFHAMGYLHLDVSPDNVLLIGRGEEERAVLIDYNSVVTLDEIKGDGKVTFSLKNGYTAPEMRMGMRRSVCFATDLYSVAAVFYRAVSGRTLTEIDTLEKTPPDVSDCKCIRDLPETVKSQVRKILVKGLARLPGKRYSTAEEMKTDLIELKERISGIGITHWSIWESGRKSVREIITGNTAFSFIKEDKKLYTVNVLTSGGLKKGSSALLGDIISGAPSAVLTGDGGMGKTTALLSAAYRMGTKYRPSSVAISYISLYGASPSDGNFIKDRILESLRFKSDTRTFETARHKLKQLLKKESAEDTPLLVLLIDGFNELLSGSEHVINEIKELSESCRVRFVITTRQYNGEFPFETARLIPLSDTELQRVLSEKGLLLPKNPELADLIRNPLMLSIFTEIAENSGKQPDISNKRELVERYFSTVSAKGVENMSESESELWLNDVCVNYILPAIAGETSRRKRALSDDELFETVKKCYKVITSKLVFKAFPQWIGHLDEILGGCETAESWYGLAVTDILWRKTGLLARDEKGGYRVFHQTIEDYLLEKNKFNQKRVFKRKLLRGTVFTASVIAVFTAVCLAISVIFPDLAEDSLLVRLQAVSKEKADYLLSDMTAAYVDYGYMYENLLLLIDDPANEAAMSNVDAVLKRTASNNGMLHLEAIRDEGGILPYSYEKISYNECEALLTHTSNNAEKYSRFTVSITDAIETEDRSYLEACAEFLQSDAEYMSMLYNYAVWEHIKEMPEKSSVRKSYENTVVSYGKINEVRSKLPDTVSGYDVEESRRARMENLYALEYVWGRLAAKSEIKDGPLS